MLPTHWLIIIVHFVIAPAAVMHALTHKRDSRAAFGWIGVCILFPIAGPALYFFFGINRIRTRARRLSGRSLFSLNPAPGKEVPLFRSAFAVGDLPPEYAQLAMVSERVTRRPVSGGNRVEILHNGEQAYPAMLKAIEESRRTLYLSSYIFQTDATGREFAKALGEAVKRGVDVRVLIDGMGEKYSFPGASRLLRKKNVPTALFLPPRLIPPSLSINLRNHRKILVSDGTTAFCGGMNIGDHHLAGNLDNPSRVTDVHFRLAGLVARQLQEVFLETWSFCTGKPPDPLAQNATQSGREAVFCRTIVDGPDEDIDKFASVLLGSISAARHRIRIMTPYFLPSRELVAALQGASLRGVEVLVILPGKSNQPIVHWATRNMLWELLRYGVRIFYQPPPFNHSKLLTVDDHYALIGSANIDPRSLRLNFELVVEVFDPSFSENLAAHFSAIHKESREITLKEVDGRPIPARIRDALCWLFTPYL